MILQVSGVLRWRNQVCSCQECFINQWSDPLDATFDGKADATDAPKVKVAIDIGRGGVWVSAIKGGEKIFITPHSKTHRK